MEREGGQGNPNHQEPTSQRNTNPQGELSRRVPPPQGEQAKPLQGSAERQPLPGVWDILEREVGLYARKSGPRKAQEYLRERHELNRLEEEIEEKGTDRDRLILDLYTYKTLIIQPGGRTPLSLKEFQQFRSQVDPLSNEEIAEERRKLEEGLGGEDKIKVYYTVHPAGAFTPGVVLDEIITNKKDKKEQTG